MTAASLTGVQVACRSVTCHFFGQGASSGDILQRGAFAPMVLKRGMFLTEMVLKRG